MDIEKTDLQIKVAFWLGFTFGILTALLGIVGIGAVTAMTGAF